ncbi:HU family DNA-binding protein [Niveibacterium sp.]|uniref:HU family DNA-binding protein n=1 Tax=Niveibacterium sp. TaxID=2017444 RepID=UPI0035B00AAA
MLRSELIDALQARLRDVPPQDVDLAVATLLSGISEVLARGGRVEIRGFGSLSTHTVPARTSRNPKTGAPVVVPPSRRITFRAGQALRASVAGDRSFP